jgi:trehalose-6-phosphate synthase
MRLVTRLICSLVACVLLVSVSSSYYQVQREKRTLRGELQKCAELLADSLEGKIEVLLQEKSAADLRRMIERIGSKEHFLGVAIYGDQLVPLAMTTSLDTRLAGQPGVVTEAMRDDHGADQFVRMGSALLHFHAVPLHGAPGVIGGMLVVHDASYIAAANRRSWREISIRIGAQICLLALTTFVVFQRSVMRPIARTTAWMRDLRNGRTPAEGEPPGSDMFGPLALEATSFAKSLADARASAQLEARLRETAESSWTAERLAVCLQTKLKGSRLFVVSNREPYMHMRQGNAVDAVVPASGLVTGLEPILRACDGTWIAHGSGNADHETVDERNCLRVPPDNPRYTLRRVWLNKKQEEGYYLGFSNEGLWPLCHIAHTRPTFRAADWEQYKDVNAVFADAVLNQIAETEHPVVIVQDYHFALLPKLLKEKRPDARVGIFWHIPWPNPEAFGICPWQRELLEGLLGADLIGFHIQAHCDNFLETVNAALESRIEWERFAVNRHNHVTLVRPFPISVAFPDASREPQRTSFHSQQAALLEEIGADALYVAVGVDRIDYTKGLLERFLGVERFLEKYPQYQGKFTFVQIGAPSRTDIKRYHDFLVEVDAESERINRRFASGRWRPILFRKWHHNHAEVSRFYRAADLCMVTSLHDGMNLVAKEFLASRDDEDGMIILSPFTGAARELPDALLVNPYDTESLADAIFTALTMNPVERKNRMGRMRAVVKQQNVYRWAGTLIGELCEVRVANSNSSGPKDLSTAQVATGEEIACEHPVYDLDKARAAGAGGHHVHG